MQLGYTWYGNKFQATGLNKNCKFLALQIGLKRVEFRAANGNEKSKTAIRTIGFVEKGVLRSHIVTSAGVRKDSIILSVLKDE